MAKLQNNYLFSLFRAFSSWKLTAARMNKKDLTDALEEENLQIDDLKKEVNELEDKNQDLTGLNQELRSEALDGIEIAKKVQDLTKERE